VILIASLLLGLLGLTDWLTGAVFQSDEYEGALKDFGSDAYFTVVVVVALLAGILVTDLFRARSGKTARNVFIGIYLVIALMTVNSLGAWLLPSALLLIVYLLVGLCIGNEASQSESREKLPS
jgi:hypothetical protein